MGNIVKVKDLPDTIKLALKRLGYRKHKAIVTYCTSVEIYGTQWDGGSRNQWFSFGPDGSVYSIRDERPWPENMGAMGARELDFARPMIICAGTFLGKKATAHVYILPAYAETIWTKDQ